MLRSLYAYKGTHARTLGFKENEKFVEIGPSRDPNWVNVISERGALGYVPHNYVIEDQQVQPLDVLEFIDGCIEATHLNASERGGNYSRNEHDALLRLVELRQEWFAKVPPSQQHPNKRPAPPPPQRTTSQLSVDSLCSQTSGGSLPSPSLPTIPSGPPATPSPVHTKSTSASTAAPASIAAPASAKVTKEPEVTTSFIVRGESVGRDESSGSSEGPDGGSTGYDSELRSEPENLPQSPVSRLLEEVPQGYLRTLVEDVRTQTSISYATSHKVAEIVLSSLGETFPALRPLTKYILTARDDSIPITKAGTTDWKESGDGRRLVQLLEKLRECKDDEQQRSWALHEDQHFIATHLGDLLDLLNHGDMDVCQTVLCLDDFRPLLTLVQYYQMETRWQLRKILLQVFGAVCQMAAVNITYLSASVLPVELTREMLDSGSEQERLQYSGLVLAMILSMGDVLPYPHFSVMNEAFLDLVLDGIELYNEMPDTEQLGELYLTILLAFNLQYTLPDSSNTTRSNSVPREDSSGRTKREGSVSKMEENLIIKLLSQRKDTKHFTEKLLLLFNREDDPVAMFEHEPRPPHAVTKMMLDLYSTDPTACLFYTNDEKVVCDIIIRQLTDLPPDDKRRNEYLHLLEGVVGRGGWQEHLHRSEEIQSRCAAIMAEDDSSEDKRIVRRMAKNHPHLFSV